MKKDVYWKIMMGFPYSDSSFKYQTCLTRGQWIFIAWQIMPQLPMAARADLPGNEKPLTKGLEQQLNCELTHSHPSLLVEKSLSFIHFNVNNVCFIWWNYLIKIVLIQKNSIKLSIIKTRIICPRSTVCPGMIWVHNAWNTSAVDSL